MDITQGMRNVKRACAAGGARLHGRLDAASRRASRGRHDITKGIAVRFWLQLGRRLGVLEPMFLSVDFRGRERLPFGVLRPLPFLAARPFLACPAPLRVAAASDAAACDSETAVGASDAAATAANASDAAASDVAAAAADADASDTSDAADASGTAVRATSAAPHAATTVGAASSASAAMHAPAAVRLHLDERVLLDSPSREHRLTLEPLATVVQLEAVSRKPRAFADVLAQGTRGLLQVGIDHDSLAPGWPFLISTCTCDRGCRSVCV